MSAATSAPAPVTAEQFFELPDDGMRHELIDGEIVSMAPTGEEHGRVTFDLGRLVGNHVHEGRLGRCYAAETGFVVRRGPDTVRAPDLAFLRAERAEQARGRGFAGIAPDFVLEVVSPSDRAGDVTAKALMWVDAGVRLVWVVDPTARLVTVYRPGNVVGLVRGDDAVLDGEDVMPGLAVRLGDVLG